MTLALRAYNPAAAVAVAGAWANRWAALLQVSLLLATYASSHPATIGDGRISLYTGRSINGSLSSPSAGSCEVDGLHYPSETAIPRDHPCHYCICYRSQITCYWKQCAAAPLGCAVMHFDNVCNPSLYMCEIPEKARPQPVRKYGDRIFSLRRRRQPRSPSSSSSSFTSSSSSSGLALAPFDEPFPVEFNDEFLSRVVREARLLDRRDGKAAEDEEEEEGESKRRRRREIGNPLYRKAGTTTTTSHHHHHHHQHHNTAKSNTISSLLKDKSCTILGVKYNLGEVIGVASDVCMECRCAAGKMFCSPRCCFLPSHLSPSRVEIQSLVESPPPPTRPHPLHYIRNQISTR